MNSGEPVQFINHNDKMIVLFLFIPCQGRRDATLAGLCFYLKPPKPDSIETNEQKSVIASGTVAGEGIPANLTGSGDFFENYCQTAPRIGFFPVKVTICTYGWGFFGKKMQSAPTAGVFAGKNAT